MKATKTFYNDILFLNQLLHEELTDFKVQKIKPLHENKAVVKFIKACEKCTLPRLVTELELQAGFSNNEVMSLLIDAFKNDAYDGLSCRIKSTQWTCACTIEQYDAYIQKLYSIN